MQHVIVSFSQTIGLHCSFTLQTQFGYQQLTNNKSAGEVRKIKRWNENRYNSDPHIWTPRCMTNTALLYHYYICFYYRLIFLTSPADSLFVNCFPARLVCIFMYGTRKSHVPGGHHDSLTGSLIHIYNIIAGQMMK
jgi:hypothetical protein